MAPWLLVASLLLTSSSSTAPPPWATGVSAGDDLAIHVVTFGSGDDIAEWFGHAAIVVEDTARAESRLYNYGEYAFDPTLALRYLKGHLTFHVGERPFARTIAMYAQKNRDVRLQTLGLSSSQKLALATLLANNVKPENRQYRYDHYSDNCTTRIRDAIDVVTDGALRRQSGPGLLTLRQHTASLTAVHPVLSVLIDVLLNDEVDRPLSTWEELFLPREFERFLDGIVVADEAGTLRPLVVDRRVLHRADRPEPPPPPSPWLLLAVGLIGAVVVVGLARVGGRRGYGVAVAVVGVVLGVPGTILFSMAVATDHHVTFWNENLLLLHPLALLLVPGGLWLALGRTPPSAIVRSTRGVITVCAALGMVAVLGKIVLPGFDQDNAGIVAVVVPVLWAMWAARRA